MDEKFLEFWGSLLLNAARSKKQTDHMLRWMQNGFPNLDESSSDKQIPDFSELSRIFRKLYGLDSISPCNDDYKELSGKALKDFQKSFTDYLALMGIVSKQEHLSLVEKYENLKVRCAEQEETIKHLKMLINAKGTSHAELSSNFENIFKNQGELFRKIMTDFGQYYNKTEPQKDSDNHTQAGKGVKGNDGTDKTDTDIQTDQ